MATQQVRGGTGTKIHVSTPKSIFPSTPIVLSQGGGGGGILPTPRGHLEYLGDIFNYFNYDSGVLLACSGWGQACCKKHPILGQPLPKKNNLTQILIGLNLRNSDRGVKVCELTRSLKAVQHVGRTRILFLIF